MVDSHTTAMLLMLAQRNVQMRAARQPDNAIHAAADAHLKPMTVAVMYGFMRGRKAYKSGGTDTAVKAIHAALLESLPPVLKDACIAGARAGLKRLPKGRHASIRTLKPKDDPFAITFDAIDQNAVNWAEEHAGELAKELSDTSRDNIKEAIANAMAGDGLDAAYDDILDAVGDEDRADMIARTETMWAANEGQQQGWDAAVEAGLLPQNAQVVWIATASEACEICEGLDGATRDLDGEYEDSEGADGPPQHPNCRCTEGIGT